jgi:hypothetical protein
VVYVDELDALKAERRAIHVEHPKYNKQHRQTTSAQVSRARPRKRARSAARRGDPEVAKRKALRILADEPDISGAKLAERVGMSKRWGQLHKPELVAMAADLEE